MNFLSHYFFHQQDSYHFNFGLVLPDLVRHFSKTHLSLLPDYNHPHKNEIKNGSHYHFQGDKLFHQSDFFNEMTLVLKEKLDEKAQWPRKWFLNHLLIEMTLDRALMEEYPDLCQQFYSDLSRVEDDLIHSFLIDSGVTNTRDFIEKHKRFVNFPFIFDYLHNEKLIYALGMVYKRVGIHYEWQSQDHDLLQNALPEIIEIAKNSIHVVKKNVSITS
jgi:hypothetical protein